MESEFDYCARRAGEEFLAAGRAATELERRLHRELAESYSGLVRLLLNRRADPGPRAGPFEPETDVEAA